MKSKWIIVGISVVALAALAIGGLVWAGNAYAQSQTPPVPSYPYGMMGGQYGGYYGMMGAGDYGPMHQYMVEAFAEALKLTPEAVQSRINAGETPWQIAQSQGLSQDQIQQLMSNVQDKALDQAVGAGLLTQEQADWMDQHMEWMWSGDGSSFGGRQGTDGDNTPAPGSYFGPMMR